MKLTRPVDWVSETKFIVDGLEFGGDLSSYTERTTSNRVVILKDSRLLRQYLDFFAPHDIKNIFELGIWQGGSPLFYGLATDARKIVALDIARHAPMPEGASDTFYENPVIAKIVEQRRLTDKVKLHFNVSQSDRAAVTAIMDEEFGDEPIDLVIDDASHEYGLSRESFEIVFPRLRMGGLYVIEDWQWAHIDSPAYQSGGGPLAGKPALTNLVFELMIAYGGNPDLFWNIVVRDWFVAIQKGSRQLTSDFRLDDLMRMRGAKLALI